MADLLVRNLTTRYPGLVVSGTLAPPYQPADTVEDREVLAKINAAAPDIFWVGLGTRSRSIGRAAPPAARRAGVDRRGSGIRFPRQPAAAAAAVDPAERPEWLFRLMHEPRRLAFRYLVYNPLFIVKIALQFAGLRRCGLG